MVEIKEKGAGADGGNEDDMGSAAGQGLERCNRNEVEMRENEGGRW